MFFRTIKNIHLFLKVKFAFNISLLANISVSSLDFITIAMSNSQNHLFYKPTSTLLR